MKQIKKVFMFCLIFVTVSVSSSKREKHTEQKLDPKLGFNVLGFKNPFGKVSVSSSKREKRPEQKLDPKLGFNVPGFKNPFEKESGSKFEFFKRDKKTGKIFVPIIGDIGNPFEGFEATEEGIKTKKLNKIPDYLYYGPTGTPDVLLNTLDELKITSWLSNTLTSLFRTFLLREMGVNCTLNDKIMHAFNELAADFHDVAAVLREGKFAFYLFRDSYLAAAIGFDLKKDMEKRRARLKHYALAYRKFIMDVKTFAELSFQMNKGDDKCKETMTARLSDYIKDKTKKINQFNKLKKKFMEQI